MIINSSVFISVLGMYSRGKSTCLQSPWNIVEEIPESVMVDVTSK